MFFLYSIIIIIISIFFLKNILLCEIYEIYYVKIFNFLIFRSFL